MSSSRVGACADRRASETASFCRERPGKQKKKQAQDEMLVVLAGMQHSFFWSLSNNAQALFIEGIRTDLQVMNCIVSRNEMRTETFL